MIGFVRGILAAKSPPLLCIDVHGLGYELQAPMSTFAELPALGEEVLVHTHLAIRDDAHQLFGFATDVERRLFRSLLKVNGVGAKMALGILSAISLHDFLTCIEQADVATLTRLPGIGRKTAERLIVEMRDRVANELADLNSLHSTTKPAVNDITAEAVIALEALGYRAAEAARMVRGVDPAGGSVEEIIRSALQRSVRS